MDIKQGDIIKSSRWNEPVEVQRVDDIGSGYTRLIGVTLHSRTAIDQIISVSELNQTSVHRVESIFTANPLQVFLSLEARRYRYADLYDPLLAMNTSKVDPLPHQIEAVYGYVLKLPRIRFLIADDPGAGKTIMAGLIIKELKMRHLVTRILIVVPGHLKDQWRRELKERFDEIFMVIDRSLMDNTYGENAWERENQVIASIDFAKRDEILPSLGSTHFDLIIADEAHKMSAYRYGDKLDKTGRYRLGEVLSRQCEHLLFLTATPHRGDPENFRLFLDLLEPGFFATTEMLQESISKKNNPLFIRRIKEDIKDFEGKPIFLPRYVKTIPFNLGTDSPLEKDLYNDLSEYVKHQYNKALSMDKKKNVAFALVILQRRFASSVYALLQSLERRIQKLTDILNGVAVVPEKDKKTADFDDAEDLNEEDRWKEEDYWETISVAENKEELKKEISILEGLAAQASQIIEQGGELKLRELKSTLQDLKVRYSGKKILIFTESRDTLDYLSKKIKSWGFTINNIHGGMRLEDRVIEEKRFKNETQILIATEAAGEGINLQFCNLMINYDIPWNPNRLEQRMGRIHRYGQTQEVFVFNLVAEDTREGKVLKRLFEKLQEIRDALGSDKVFDVLSEILYGKNLSQIMMEAAANAKSVDELLEDIEIEVDEEYITKVKESLGDTLATRHIDYTRIKEMAIKARESRLIPEYTEAFFKKVLQLVGGRLTERKDKLLTIEGVPSELRQFSQDPTFRMRYGTILRTYHRMTFDKDIAFKNPDAEFLCFGHPLFEAALAYVEQNMTDTPAQGSIFVDPDGRLDGFILFYDADITDGKNSIAGKRLFSLYIEEKTQEVQEMNPALLWDLSPSKKTVQPPEDFNLESLKSRAFGSLIPVLDSYKSELEVERNRQAEIKEKYGIKSLEHLILRLDGDLIILLDRKDRGDNVDLAIRNKESRKTNYEKSLEKLRQTIIQEKTLTMGSPRFVGIIRVIPALVGGGGMHSDKEIEMAGMNYVMEYEKNKGRSPEDISRENLGFDIRSTDETGGVRYIEVKARAGSGAIEITQNEWFKAQRFEDDYFLYVVFKASSNPELLIIRNPAVNLDARPKIELVRYVVEKDQIVEKGLTG